ncbi:MAG: Csu type fimbrial protein, partial [Candidatus Binatia bacterium]
LAGIAVVVGSILFFAEPAAAQFCRVEVTGDVGFGDYDPLESGDLDASGQIRYRCPAAVLIARVKITSGSSGSFSPRTMTQGGEQLGYNLYLDASRSVVWGDGTGGTSFLTLAPPSPLFQSQPVYARTSLGQDVSAGAYGDSVVVVLEW